LALSLSVSALPLFRRRVEGFDVGREVRHTLVVDVVVEQRCQLPPQPEACHSSGTDRRRSDCTQATCRSFTCRNAPELGRAASLGSGSRILP
jgi:hypothetical protein